MYTFRWCQIIYNMMVVMKAGWRSPRKDFCLEPQHPLPGTSNQSTRVESRDHSFRHLTLLLLLPAVTTQKFSRGRKTGRHVQRAIRKNHFAVIQRSRLWFTWSLMFYNSFSYKAQYSNNPALLQTSTSRYYPNTDAHIKHVFSKS